MFDRLIPSSSDESETSRDGSLSTQREIHASVVGFVVGVVVAMLGAWELAGLFVFATLGSKLGSKYLGDIRREPWYALGFFLMGAAITMLSELLAIIS